MFETLIMKINTKNDQQYFREGSYLLVILGFFCLIPYYACLLLECVYEQKRICQSVCVCTYEVQ